MAASLLLLLFLFIAGFVNVYFYFPRKKFHAWLQSFFPNNPPKAASASAAVSVAVASTQVIPPKEKRDSNRVELEMVFATFDKNGDGFITKQELRDSLKNIRLFMTEKEVEDMVIRVDANGDGLIDFDEFCILCQAMEGGEESGMKTRGGGDDGEDELKEAFDVFDKDKDGLISVEELGSVLCSLGLKEGNRTEDCKAMIRKVDMDGDGMVNFDEFKKMMKSGFSLC